jgi:hypothetical protein
MPAILEERLIRLLRQNGLFEDWPLETIVPDAQGFFAFLQERWPVFLDSLAKLKDDAVHEDASRYGFEFPGPALLPFDHHDVRIYIDDLFLEGLLQPVPHEQSQALAKSWVAYGIKVSPVENRRRRMAGLLDSIEKTIPTVEARHGEWLHFAYRWPVMLHHIPRFIARSLGDDRRTKVASLLVDGLALDQWIALREVLGELDSKLRFREDLVFAWIPTITSVSRQAAFAGKPPIYFPASIHTTDKEAGLWTLAARGG